ncbi:MAG: aminoacyl-tRNA hydrolase [Lachnospiraceae bacterium]|nr:aminoacyl-tRNA hydrolase [Lachnospiraceae bacterium]
MYLIAGLGNPGKDYDNTRHNAGFAAIDTIADTFGIKVMELKHKGILGKGMIGGEKVILLKPQTYMNLSGESIREVVEYYKIDPESEVIVLCDDIALETGAIRIREKGSAGGHNGLKNIILHLHTENFIRVRIGVGDKPKEGDLVNHVLGHFAGEDAKQMQEANKQIAKAVECMIMDGPQKAMSQYNTKKKK